VASPCIYYVYTGGGHLLEEASLDATKPIDISAGDQFKPEFLRTSPNNRMPAIVDTTPADGGEPISVFESGAILLYLAEKTGKFIPADLRDRKRVTEWLFWQVGVLVQWLGKTIILCSTLQKIPYAIDRYVRKQIGSMAYLTVSFGA